MVHFILCIPPISINKYICKKKKKKKKMTRPSKQATAFARAGVQWGLDESVNNWGHQRFLTSKLGHQQKKVGHP